MDRCIDHPEKKAIAFAYTDFGMMPVCRECWNKLKIHQSMYGLRRIKMDNKEDEDRMQIL